MYIQPHSQATAHSQLTLTELGEEEKPPLPFLKSKKSVVILERKTLILSILELIFSIQNEVLRVSRR